GRELSRALEDLAPLLVVAGDLIRAVPAELAVDGVLVGERADQRLRSFGEAPDPQGPLGAVPSRGGDEVLRDAREQEAGVPSARSLGHAARLEHRDTGAGLREEVRGRDAGHARAHDRDVRGRISVERWIGASSAVQPKTHARECFTRATRGRYAAAARTRYALLSSDRSVAGVSSRLGDGDGSPLAERVHRTCSCGVEP